jgi:hypothetical protein
VSGIVVQEHFDDLVISTYGRGFYILDDITPLQQLAPEVMASAAHLFEPRAAYRFREITRPSTTYDDPATGENPPFGASINYWLKAPAASPPTLTISDASGQVIRTLRGPNRAGLNRVQWDLEDEPTSELRLLTSPMYASHIAVGPEGRSAQGVSRLTVLQPPGGYTVKLTVGDAELTRTLEVRKDPHSGGSEADIAEQVGFLRTIKQELEVGANFVRRIEALRVQLDVLGRFTSDAEVKRSAEALGSRLVELEMNLVDLRLTGQGQDGIRFEAKLLQKLGYLAGTLSGADFQPTDQQVQVLGILRGQLRQQVQALDTLVGQELAGLNALLRAKGLGIIAGED